MESTGTKDGPSIRIALAFFSAGTSALLIAVAHLRPEYWFVSLFALVPFLWRAARAGLGEAVFLGAALATSYCLVTASVASWEAVRASLPKLLSLNLLFVLYSVAVNRMACHVGFNAVFVAVFWLPIEWSFNRFAQVGNVFGFAGTSSELVTRISSVFGALMLSFLVVLINSLIVIVSARLAHAEGSCARPCGRSSAACEFHRWFEDIQLKLQWYYSASPRSPPSS